MPVWRAIRGECSNEKRRFWPDEKGRSRTACPACDHQLFLPCTAQLHTGRSFCLSSVRDFRLGMFLVRKLPSRNGMTERKWCCTVQFCPVAPFEEEKLKKESNVQTGLCCLGNGLLGQTGQWRLDRADVGKALVSTEHDDDQSAETDRLGKYLGRSCPPRRVFPFGRGSDVCLPSLCLAAACSRRRHQHSFGTVSQCLISRWRHENEVFFFR